MFGRTEGSRPKSWYAMMHGYLKSLNPQHCVCTTVGYICSTRFPRATPHETHSEVMVTVMERTRTRRNNCGHIGDGHGHGHGHGANSLSQTRIDVITAVTLQTVTESRSRSRGEFDATTAARSRCSSSIELCIPNFKLIEIYPMEHD